MLKHDDFDFEDSPGIPAPLPPGEYVVWQGSPNAWQLARHAFHWRKVAIYFMALLLIQAWSFISNGSDSSAIWASLSLTALLSALGLSILGVLAWLTARVTIYTVTNRRILIRFGIALQMTINLPFSQIQAADMRITSQGYGDIPLVLKENSRVNYFVLWPHVRPWQFSAPQPMLRSIPKVRNVAQIIAKVASESSGLATSAAPLQSGDQRAEIRDEESLLSTETS